MSANKQPSEQNFLSSIKVSFWTFSSRIFGLLRDISTTNLFGASLYHDIFVVVLRIPNLFRRFFAEGAFNQAFVPILSDIEKTKDPKQVKDFIDSLAGILISTLFVFTIICLLFAPFVIFIFAPGFYFDSEKQNLAVNVLRIMFPYLALISLVAFAAGIQNTHSRFSLPAATPIIFNLTLIIFALLIAPRMTTPLISLSWGVFLAGVLQLIIQFAPLKAIDRLPVPKVNLNNSDIPRFFKLIVPAVLAGGVTQINLLIDTIFASLLETGSPTWLYISDRLIQFPLGIFAIAIGTVLLPSLSRSAANKDNSQFKASLDNSFRLVIFIAIPSLIGLIYFAEPIIASLFYRGEFSEFDVIKSSYSLVFFCYGLPFFMLMKVLTPAFFSRQDTKTPFYVALFSLFLNAILNYIFAFKLGYGHAGLAIGSSLAVLASSCILFFVLMKQNLLSLSIIFHKTNFAAIFSSLIMFLAFDYFVGIDSEWMSKFYEYSGLVRISLVAVIVILSCLFYFFISKWVFRVSNKDFYL